MNGTAKNPVKTMIEGPLLAAWSQIMAASRQKSEQEKGISEVYPPPPPLRPKGNNTTSEQEEVEVGGGAALDVSNLTDDTLAILGELRAAGVADCEANDIILGTSTTTMTTGTPRLQQHQHQYHSPQKTAHPQFFPADCETPSRFLFGAPTLSEKNKQHYSSGTPETVGTEEDMLLLEEALSYPHSYFHQRTRSNSAGSSSIVEAPAATQAPRAHHHQPHQRQNAVLEEEHRPVVIFVDDYETDTFAKLVQTLEETSKVLKHVELHRLRQEEPLQPQKLFQQPRQPSSSFSSTTTTSSKQPSYYSSQRRVRTSTEMAYLFAALKGLPQLETLKLVNFESHFDLDLIATYCHNQATLQRLWVHFLQGSPDVVLLDIWAEATPHLTELVLEVTEPFPLQRLLQSDASRLQRLTITSSPPPPQPTTCTPPLLNNNAGIKFVEQDLVGFMQALGTNQTLQYLNLRQPCLSALSMKALSFAIADNQTLETLQFSYAGNNNVTEAGKILVDISFACSRNSRLLHLHNHLASLVRVQEVDKARMTNHLTNNEVLEHFEFYQIDDDDRQAAAANEDDSSASAGHKTFPPLIDHLKCLTCAGLDEFWIHSEETLTMIRSKMASAPLPRSNVSVDQNSLISQIQTGIERSLSKYSAKSS